MMQRCFRESNAAAMLVTSSPSFDAEIERLSRLRSLDDLRCVPATSCGMCSFESQRPGSHEADIKGIAAAIPLLSHSVCEQASRIDSDGTSPSFNLSRLSRTLSVVARLLAFPALLRLLLHSDSTALLNACAKVAGWATRAPILLSYSVPLTASAIAVAEAVVITAPLAAVAYDVGIPAIVLDAAMWLHSIGSEDADTRVACDLLSRAVVASDLALRFWTEPVGRGSRVGAVIDCFLRIDELRHGSLRAAECWLRLVVAVLGLRDPRNAFVVFRLRGADVIALDALASLWGPHRSLASDLLAVLPVLAHAQDAAAAEVSSAVDEVSLKVREDLSSATIFADKARQCLEHYSTDESVALLLNVGALLRKVGLCKLSVESSCTVAHFPFPTQAQSRICPLTHSGLLGGPPSALSRELTNAIGDTLAALEVARSCITGSAWERVSALRASLDVLCNSSHGILDGIPRSSAAIGVRVSALIVAGVENAAGDVNGSAAALACLLAAAPPLRSVLDEVGLSGAVIACLEKAPIGTLRLLAGAVVMEATTLDASPHWCSATRAVLTMNECLRSDFPVAFRHAVKSYCDVLAVRDRRDCMADYLPTWRGVYSVLCTDSRHDIRVLCEALIDDIAAADLDSRLSSLFPFDCFPTVPVCAGPAHPINMRSARTTLVEVLEPSVSGVLSFVGAVAMTAAGSMPGISSGSGIELSQMGQSIATRTATAFITQAVSQALPPELAKAVTPLLSATVAGQVPSPEALRAVAVSALASSSRFGAALSPLFGCLLSGHVPTIVNLQEAAINCVKSSGKFGDAAAPLLGAVLRGEVPTLDVLRRAALVAAKSATNRHGEAAVPLLNTLLCGGVPSADDVRTAAVRCVRMSGGKFGASAALLVDSVFEGKIPMQDALRNSVTASLSATGRYGAAAAPLLESLLQGRPPSLDGLRAAAVASVAASGRECAAVAPFVDAVLCGDVSGAKSLAASAARSLAGVKYGAALPLVQCLVNGQHASNEVINKAVLGLVSATGTWGAAAAPMLGAALHHENPFTEGLVDGLRAAAVRSVGSTGKHGAALAPLLDSVLRGDMPDAGLVRRAAIKSISAMGRYGTSAAPVVEEVLRQHFDGGGSFSTDVLRRAALDVVCVASSRFGASSRPALDAILRGEAPSVEDIRRVAVCAARVASGSDRDDAVAPLVEAYQRGALSSTSLRMAAVASVTAASKYGAAIAPLLDSVLRGEAPLRVDVVDAAVASIEASGRQGVAIAQLLGAFLRDGTPTAETIRSAVVNAISVSGDAGAAVAPVVDYILRNDASSNLHRAVVAVVNASGVQGAACAPLVEAVLRRELPSTSILIDVADRTLAAAGMCGKAVSPLVASAIRGEAPTKDGLQAVAVACLTAAGESGAAFAPLLDALWQEDAFSSGGSLVVDTAHRGDFEAGGERLSVLLLLCLSCFGIFHPNCVVLYSPCCPFAGDVVGSGFDAAFNLLMRAEGGYCHRPSDPGGCTNHGVTQRAWEAYVGHRVNEHAMKSLTRDEIRLFYQKLFWDEVSCGELPAGIGYAIFDFAVNSGPGIAIRCLQTVIGMRADGKMGPDTIAASHAAAAAQGAGAVIDAICEKRLAFLLSLKNWKDSCKGWIARVSRVRSDARSFSCI